jgi:hypothetical protein
MPEDVRARIRAVIHRDMSAQKSEKLVEQLVNQPGSGRIGFLVLITTIPSLLAWPAAIAAAIFLYMLCYLRAFNAIALAVAALAIVGASTPRPRPSPIAKRPPHHAAFAARAPTTAGGAHHCRGCNAPRRAAGGVVVRCALQHRERWGSMRGRRARGQSQRKRSKSRSFAERWAKPVSLLGARRSGSSRFARPDRRRLWPPHPLTAWATPSYLARDLRSVRRVSTEVVDEGRSASLRSSRSYEMRATRRYDERLERCYRAG